MMTYFLLFLILVSVIIDIHIFRRQVMRNYNRAWQAGYWICMLAVNIIMMLSALSFRSALDVESTVKMRLTMLGIGIFFLAFIPRVLLTIFMQFDIIREHITNQRSLIFGRIGAFIALIVAGVMLWGMTYGRMHLKVDEIEIVSERLPKSFDGFRIAFFTDPHTGNLIHARYQVNKLVERINSLDADIVVNGGDLVNSKSSELTPVLMDVYSRLESRYGTYSVMGNHDLGFYLSERAAMTPEGTFYDMIDRQNRMGWKLLINQSDLITNGKDTISISGINYPKGDKLNNRNDDMGGVDYDDTYKGVPDGMFNIMISHTPDEWDHILAINKSDLTLSGHVHAMQFKINIGDWSWSPAKLRFKRWSGLYVNDDKSLYINDGFGYVLYPMRIGTNPSVTVITLRSTGV